MVCFAACQAEATSDEQGERSSSGPHEPCSVPQTSQPCRRHAHAATLSALSEWPWTWGSPTVRTTSGRSASGSAPSTRSRSPPCTVKGPCTPLPHSARQGRWVRRFGSPRWANPGLGPATTRTRPVSRHVAWLRQGLPVEKRGRVRGVVGWRDGGHWPQVVQRFGERHVQWTPPGVPPGHRAWLGAGRCVLWTTRLLRRLRRHPARLNGRCASGELHFGGCFARARVRPHPPGGPRSSWSGMRAWVASAKAGPWFNAAVPTCTRLARGEGGQGQAERVVGGRPFVHAHVHFQVRVVVHGHHQRGVARSWAGHDVAHAAFDEHFRDDGRGGMRTGLSWDVGHVSKVGAVKGGMQGRRNEVWPPFLATLPPQKNLRRCLRRRTSSRPLGPKWRTSDSRNTRIQGRGPTQESCVVHAVVGFLVANECGRLRDRESAYGRRGVQGLGQPVQVATAGGRDACFEVGEFAVVLSFGPSCTMWVAPFWASTLRMWSVTSRCSTRSLSVQAADGFRRVPARDTVSTSCCWARNKSSVWPRTTCPLQGGASGKPTRWGASDRGWQRLLRASPRRSVVGLGTPRPWPKRLLKWRRGPGPHCLCALLATWKEAAAFWPKSGFQGWEIHTRPRGRSTTAPAKHPPGQTARSETWWSRLTQGPWCGCRGFRADSTTIAG